jgi:hypothetical protein
MRAADLRQFSAPNRAAHARKHNLFRHEPPLEYVAASLVYNAKTDNSNNPTCRFHEWPALSRRANW